ncbi:retropepsin-like aspartic protease family protein [Thiorhodospira sibirica]|uniref:retropepsin-like aspartic protease family protein n=1 Tax=Thiorhodospira sibirica TaxID=154347 RepID=UPI0002F78C3E|nr:TIGR02281 family clan AA aspartic protease [Thiorhodospira sibirica]
MDVQVLAVFSDRAVIQIGDERTQLKIGESSTSGARLLSTDARMGRVRLLMDDQEREFTLGGRVGGAYQTPRQASTRIYRDSSGAYTTTGSINGTAVRFLVDTGASSVVLSATQAQRLNIDYSRGVLTPVMTASGNTLGYRIVLDHVIIGSIRQHHVQALVLPGDSPHIALLGMSFLNALNLRNESGALVLEQRY